MYGGICGSVVLCGGSMVWCVNGWEGVDICGKRGLGGGESAIR